MAEIRNENVNRALQCFTYQRQTSRTRVITEIVERSVPGLVTATTAGGVTWVNQSVDTVLDRKTVGTKTDHYAVFENDQSGILEFQISSGHYFPSGARLYLWLDKEFWLFQTDDMPAPRVQFGKVPNSEAFPVWYPDKTSGDDFNTEETQLSLKAALYPLKEFLAGIKKNTPRNLLSVQRLQEIFGKAKSDAAARYNSATWPKTEKDRGVFGWVLAPILKYKAVPASTPFCPKQTISAAWNRRWLSLGIVAGTVTFWLLGSLWVGSVIRTFGLNQVFWMMTLTGAALQWLAFILLALTGLAVVMAPATRRPFAFDESSFFTLLNTPYHQKARVGFSANTYSEHASIFGKDFSSDKEMEDLNIWRAHEQCSFPFNSFAKLTSMLGATKLSEMEKASVLIEIRNHKLPF